MVVAFTGPPVFVQQPANLQIASNTTVVFTASAQGATSYQWKKNGSNVGANSTTYTGVCILQNSALHFYPMNSWGLYVPVRFNGNTRPILDLAHMDGDMHFCKERKDAEAKQVAEEKEIK